MKKVIAIVVTFNRIELLKRCILGIRDQSYPVHRIVVIDNASTDGTNEWVVKEGIKNEPRIDYVRLKENVGGAGGFNAGIARALELDGDWLWLMDDDGVPAKNALEMLLNAQTKSLIRNSLVVSIDDYNTLCFTLKLNGSKVETLSEVKKLDTDIIEGIAFPFNGTLISSTIPKKIGLPLKEMFIWGDEIEYMERAKKNNFFPVLVSTSIHYHPLDKAKRSPVLGGLAHVSVPESRKRLYILLRNHSYIWSRYSLAKLALMILKYLVYAVTNNDKRVIPILLSALRDGISARWGNEAKYLE